MSRDAALWHVCLPDVHVPFEDKEAVAVALAALRVLRPELHGVTFLGDVPDVSPWSSHPRRSLAEKPAEHREEMDALRVLLRATRKAAGPRAKRWIEQGNHEVRVVRELLRIGRPDLIAMCDPTHVMEAEGWGVTPYAASPQEHVLWTTDAGRKLIACHGAYEGTQATRKHAQARHWRGHFIVHGHTHRVAHHVEIEAGTGRRLEALSPGCLSRLDPPWCAPRATDWDHGIAVFRLSRARIDGYVCKIERGACVLPDGREVHA